MRYVINFWNYLISQFVAKCSRKGCGHSFYQHDNFDGCTECACRAYLQDYR